MSLLEVRDATVEFSGPGGPVRAMDGVSLSVQPGEIVAVVGESGCGKTTLARAILGLQPLKGGEIELQGERVDGVSPDAAKRVGMVWQDPFASLDPRWSMERSAAEAGRIAGSEVAIEPLFQEVGLAATHRQRFPHQMSGGQRQRVAIARAISLRPPLVICDEPTAALDLSIRAQILNLIKQIRSDLGCSFLYISHDLTTVRFLADRIAVMYLGKIVETGPTEEVFADPRHPYTAALLESAPTLESLGHVPEAPAGELPDPHNRPPGCPFEPRCPRAQEVCRSGFPGATAANGRSFHCNFPVEPVR